MDNLRPYMITGQCSFAGRLGSCFMMISCFFVYFLGGGFFIFIFFGMVGRRCLWCSHEVMCWIRMCWCHGDDGWCLEGVVWDLLFLYVCLFVPLLLGLLQFICCWCCHCNFRSMLWILRYKYPFCSGLAIFTWLLLCTSAVVIRVTEVCEGKLKHYLFKFLENE